MASKCTTCHSLLRPALDQPSGKVCRNPKCNPKKKQFSAKSTFPSLKLGGKKP